MKFSAKYPVLLQKDKVKPGVYQGKKGLPLLIETETWKNIDLQDQDPDLIESTGMIPTAQTEAEVKTPIYETRAILDYNEWDQINDAGK